MRERAISASFVRCRRSLAWSLQHFPIHRRVAPVCERAAATSARQSVPCDPRVYNQALAAAGARCWNSILQGARGADTTTPFSFQALFAFCQSHERGWTWIMPVSALIARAFVEHNRCVMRATIHEHTLRKKATTRLESQTRAPSTFDRARRERHANCISL